MTGRTGRAAIVWLTTRWMRRRWVAMVPLALIVLVGTAGTVAAFAAAQRTESAYDDYLERGNVGDVVLNPSLNSREIDEVIRSLPGAEEVTSSAFYTVTRDDGRPRPRGEIESDSQGSLESVTTVFASVDGRYLDMDRPAVRDGRLPTGTREAAVTVETAAAEGLGVGDTISLAFWQPGLADGLTPEEYEVFSAEVIEPIGVEEIEIVGIVTLADEVLPDELYPRQKAILSPDVAARYDCLPSHPPAGLTVPEVVSTFFPDDCAAGYRYYSISTAPGVDVSEVLGEYARRAEPLNEELAQLADFEAVDAEGPEYFPIVAETALEERRVERSIRPTVTALLVLGLATAAVTVALAGLAAARELRRTQPEQLQWHQLGIGARARTIVVAAPAVVAVLCALLAGVVTGWLLDVGPVGLVGAIEPQAARQLSSTAVLAAVTISVVVVGIVVALAVRSSRRIQPFGQDVGVTPGGRRIAARVTSPAVADGVRAAYGQRSALPVIAGGAVLAATVVAAAVFGISLSRLVETPESYGWTWDVAGMTGSGYGDLDLDQAVETLDNDPDVESWTALGFANDFAVNGELMMSMIAFERTSDTELAVLDGSLPDSGDEVAVGATTADDGGLEVGDRVEVSAVYLEPFEATVSGIVVFPSLGQLLADRVSTGTGLLLPEAMFEAPGREHMSGEARGLATFVGVDIRDHSDTAATRQRLQAQIGKLDTLGIPATPYSQPVRPPEIVDARSTRAVPVAVGIVLAVVAAVGIAFASWASVRSRRRDLAVLRTLGFKGSQVRRSVRVQSLATMAAALLIGVPVGVIVGRVLWRGFADQLGVIPDPASPWTIVGLAVIGGLVIAALAAQLPAVLAARATPAEGLRAE